MSKLVEKVTADTPEGETITYTITEAVKEAGLKVKTVSVEYQRKLNLGNYESELFGATAWADLEPWADPDRALMTLADLVRLNVAKRASKRIKTDGGPVVDLATVLAESDLEAPGAMPRL